ncbi:MAG: JAB domain-containing protein, partial [Clostridia bacterium]|nr:JAB domain-containing protein [Clostridia bacterium]
FLDKGGRLLLTEKISEGTVNSSDIIPRRALEAAARLKSKAKGAILAHNHPGGTVSVSESDIYATAVMRQALSGVGIELLRHYVVADGQVGLIN